MKIDNTDATNSAPPPALPGRLPPQALVGYGLLFGLLMIALALAWDIMVNGDNLRDWFAGAHPVREVLVGALCGTFFAAAAWWLADRVPALKQIERLLVHTLDMNKLRWHHAVWIGLVAGIPEEILFRGALQPSLGLPLTAVIFGALHGISRAYFAYATVAGLLLGALADWRGSLWAPAAAHTVIDLILMLLLMRRHRRHPPPS